jgi:hypothetical protein
MRRRVLAAELHGWCGPPLSALVSRFFAWVGLQVGGVRSGTLTVAGRLAVGEMAAGRAPPWPLARAEVRPGLAGPA